MILLIVKPAFSGLIGMFEIKAKVDYGLLIMTELAKNPRELTPISVIAKRMDVSSSYLSQIAANLVQAGLIKSREGSQGGYGLTKAPIRISVLEIIEALDGHIESSCVLDKGAGCPHAAGCHVRGAWEEILPDLKTVLKKRSLASLLRK